MARLALNVDFPNLLKIRGLIDRDYDNARGLSFALPAGNVGTLSTRTSDTLGVVELSAGHTVPVQDYGDLHHAGGILSSMYYGTHPDATHANVVLSAPDVLPAAGAAICAAVRITILAPFAGDQLKLLAAICDRAAVLHLAHTHDVAKYHRELIAGELHYWAAALGAETNPAAGMAITSLMASNGEGVAGTLECGIVLDTA